MLVHAPEPPPGGIDGLLDPTLMQRLGRLDVLSRKVFSGKLPGERRSKRRGRSVEFDDFRPYTPGDDPRSIDWNVLARLDRLVVKLFRAEEDLGVRLVLDASPSMGAGAPTKALLGARLCVAVGAIGLANNDRVGMTVFGGPSGTRSLRPVRGRRHLPRVAAFALNALDPSRDESTGPQEGLSAALRRVAADPSGGQGLVVVVSDFLDRGGYLAGLDALAARGHYDVVCVQVLSAGEMDPASEAERGLVGDLRLTDAEGGPDAEVTLTPGLVKAYRRRLEAFVAGLGEACAARGMTHLVVRSDADVGDLIERSLRERGVLG